jgi:hypothetical protein
MYIRNVRIALLICLLFVVTHSFGYPYRVPNKYKKYFINCCNPKSTTIRLLINIDGYYKLKTSWLLNPRDTIYTNMLFYEDGICVSGWGGYDSNRQQFLNSVITKGPKHWFYENCSWGFYEINGDTIVVRSIVPGTFMRPVSVEERWYKIIDRNTIQKIYSTSLEKMTAKAKASHRKAWANFIGSPSKFYPLQNTPPSNYSWLRKQKCKLCK